MIAAAASADALTWLSIIVKAMTYAATLIATGGALVIVALKDLSQDGHAALRRSVVAAAVAAAVLSLLRLPLRAGFLMGGTLEGALDPMMLGMVAESPLGTSVALRLAGLALLLAILLPGRVGAWVAVFGAGLACVSFALRGHALGDPRLLLGTLVSVHTLGLAFWVGALAPLARAAQRETPALAGALADDFGTMALWIVGALVVAGAITLGLLGAARPAALATAYGQMFAVKLALFACVLWLAALNKLRLTPALRAAAPGAATRLRRSIVLEAGLIGLILVVTSALTTLSSPPGA